MITLKRGVEYTQARGCRFVLHIGTWAFYFGRKDGEAPRLELFTPLHWFRWSGVRR